MSQSWAEKMRHQLSAKKITGLLVFGAIVLVFVFFGFSGKMEGGAGSVARVNHALISIAEFQNEEQRIQRIQEYYAQMFGQNFPSSPERQKELRKEAVNSLVQMELLSQASAANGLGTVDSEIVDLIRQTPEFQKDGLFQSDIYFGLLKANRLTPADYESKVRKQVEQNRVQELFQISASPSQLELKKNKELKSMKMNVAFVKLSSDEMRKNMDLPDSQIKAALENPEFLKRAQTDFENFKNEYTKNQKIKAQHILITFKSGDLVSEKKAEEKIKEIKMRTEKEDFGKLASELSEDPGSKAKKGDLGFFTRGRMVPEFESAAFSQKIGVVSEPVRTQYGYHLIKVNEREAVDFSNYKNEVAKKLLALDFLEKKMKGIEESLSKGDLSTIESEFKAIGLKWEETGYFDLTTDVVPKLPGESFNKAIYELSPSSKLAKEVVRSGADKYILLLKDIKTEVVAEGPNEADTLKQQRASQWMTLWLEEFRKKSNVEINSQVLNM